MSICENIYLAHKQETSVNKLTVNWWICLHCRFPTVKKKDGGALELNEKHDSSLSDYDPFAHRKVEHPTTSYDTFFHLLKGSLGTGILAMPNAFNNSGYVRKFYSSPKS